jgi:hypothetical protein
VSVHYPVDAPAASVTELTRRMDLPAAGVDRMADGLGRDWAPFGAEWQAKTAADRVRHCDSVYPNPAPFAVRPLADLAVGDPPPAQAAVTTSILPGGTADPYLVLRESSALVLSPLFPRYWSPRRREPTRPAGWPTSRPKRPVRRPACQRSRRRSPSRPGRGRCTNQTPPSGGPRRSWGRGRSRSRFTGRRPSPACWPRPGSARKPVLLRRWARKAVPIITGTALPQIMAYLARQLPK